MGNTMDLCNSAGKVTLQTNLPDNINATVDLAVFAGQSNMSGRGDAVDAIKCDINAGFEYKSQSRSDSVRIRTELLLIATATEQQSVQAVWLAQ